MRKPSKIERSTFLRTNNHTSVSVEKESTLQSTTSWLSIASHAIEGYILKMNFHLQILENIIFLYWYTEIYSRILFTGVKLRLCIRRCKYLNIRGFSWTVWAVWVVWVVWVVPVLDQCCHKLFTVFILYIQGWQTTAPLSVIFEPVQSEMLIQISTVEI